MPTSRVGGFFAQRPWIISLVLFVGLSLWMGLGVLKAEEETQNKKSQENKEVEIPLARVVVTSFNAEPVAKKIDLYGRTAPDRIVNVSAETGGKIIALDVRKGEYVKKGQILASIDKSDLSVQMVRAKAMLKVKQKEYDAAKSLKTRGLQGEVAFANAEASLADAKATVDSAQTALNDTVIKAPFNGILDELHVEEGDFVARGDRVAKILDLEKLVIQADLSERHIQQVAKGQVAKVTLLNGQQVAGVLSYVSRTSSVTTNTFPIEVEIENKGLAVPAGISAEVELELDTRMAVKLTPAMLALDDAGNLGVKTLRDDHVEFVGIQIVKAEQDGVWLSGLGEQVDVITVGQGFVRSGDQVIAVRQ
ncbi:hemolysin D [Vibrio sp. qd031]|uniref:efflux RND transporter periplasmic adaptor subunit n=1 Tax=Vibrio sp. qd031 TaxID=1603038 RepID=UPI000A1123AD|nr:efflux RND transporter periplasmic adaptor subunit [Vibrio sp. qd031]ORT48905.1 hemolysin D [Vibrio sp. qd031]